MFIKIRGKDHYLWRAVGQEGEVLDIIVQSRRDKKAAKKFLRKLLKGLQYVPGVIITHQLRSYGAAKADIMPGVEHHRDKGLNNRAENSHQPTRLIERVMRRFKSAGHARALSFRLGDHLVTFPPRATSLYKGRLPGSDEVKIWCVERGELRSNCGLKRVIKPTK